MQHKVPGAEKNNKHAHHLFLTTGAGTSKPKYTTRSLAALDFLINIPLAKESGIRKIGTRNLLRISGEAKQVDQGEANNLNLEDNISPIGAAANGAADDANDVAEGARKLRGPDALFARLPTQLRYHMAVHSAAVRQWEDRTLSTSSATSTIGQPLLASRLFYSRVRSYPTLVSSVIKYDARKEHNKLARLNAVDAKGREVFEVIKRDWRGFSYKTLLNSLVELYAERGSTATEYSHMFWERGYLYDPNFVDDPCYNHGSTRLLNKGSSATGPVISSIILFVKKNELKESLNEKFRSIHPTLPPSLTLSKIRNLKKLVLLSCINIGIEISTVAIAVICFERLCLKALVTKSNRRLSMAVCLVLAFKYNEPHILSSTTQPRQRMEALMDFFGDEWELTKKQVLDAEFGAYVQLGFSLQFPSQHVYLVYTRLLKLIGKSSKQYLGEELSNTYVQDLMDIDRTQRNAAVTAALEQ